MKKFVYNDPNIKLRRRVLRKNQTDAERFLWKHLRNKQISDLKFYRQYSVGGYILDFYCSKRRLGIELDGSQHNEISKKLYDEQRTIFLENQSIKVLRFWNNEVLNNIEGVVMRIRELV